MVNTNDASLHAKHTSIVVCVIISLPKWAVSVHSSNRNVDSERTGCSTTVLAVVESLRHLGVTTSPCVALLLAKTPQIPSHPSLPRCCIMFLALPHCSLMTALAFPWTNRRRDHAEMTSGGMRLKLHAFQAGLHNSQGRRRNRWQMQKKSCKYPSE